MVSLATIKFPGAEMDKFLKNMEFLQEKLQKSQFEEKKND